MASNSQLPYDVIEEDDWNYSFTTKHGIVYHAYFLDFSTYHPSFSDVYTFNIEPDNEKPHPIDNRIAQTIVHILKSFFTHKKNSMLMVCDNLDGKEIKRKNLFTRWFNQYKDGNIDKYDASANTEDYVLYVSIYIHKENPNKRELISAFYDLIKNNLYTID